MVNEEAEEHKQRGNDAFKAKNWDDAIKHYNKAVALDPNNAAYYSNRAGAWTSKGNHDSALADANKCLNQDSQFVKGYSRKGKALFDLQKWDEAEAAYKEGLEVDANNEGCIRGLADIKSAKDRIRAATSRSRSAASSGGGGLGSAFGGFVPKLMDRFKKGGRMQMYLVMLLGYYAFTTMTGRNSKRSTTSDSPGTPDSLEFDDEGEVASAAPGQLVRQFAEARGAWFSYLQVMGKSDATLIMLHRTSSSAEVEFGAMMPQLASVGRVLAPDRPCHGYSPCPADGEPSDGSYLNSLLVGRPSAKRFGLVAAGREAAEQALKLARRRPEVQQIWLIAPSVAGPEASKISNAEDVRGWLKEQSTDDPIAAIDSARWAVLGGATSKASANLSVAGLPKGCKVTMLYGEKDAEDEELSQALDSEGITANVRNLGGGEAMLDVLVEEVQQAMGESDAGSASHEEEE